ncbi:MAG: PaaI family thioesterase [Myxococcota bacterium]
MADMLDMMNNQPGGWNRAMGLRFTTATPDLVEAEWTVGPEHLQPFGIVHGGVHCGVIEAVCSVGAAVAAAAHGHVGGVVGLENHTSFIKAVRAGAVLTALATPLTRGRTTHVWQAEIRDQAGGLIATGRVRLLCVTRDQLPK